MRARLPTSNVARPLLDFMTFLRRENLFRLMGFILGLVVLGAAGLTYFEDRPFDDAIWWAIVTLTTVGYGDISPRTPLGQTLAAAIMILGYGLIAVPTGLVSMEISLALSRHQKRVCPECGTAESDPDAKFCRRCSAGPV